MTTFKIEEIKHNPLDSLPTKHPDANYGWNIRKKGATSITNSGMDYRDVELLFKFFKVSRPQDLTGRTFEVPEEYDCPSSALDYFLTHLRREGN